jgi:hypothetical protein
LTAGSRLQRLMTVLVVSLCPLLMLMSTAEAWAARAIVRDKRGDARAPWDITKVVVVNGQRKLKIRVVYRGRLRPHLPRGLFTDVGLDLGPPSDFVEETDFDVSLLLGSKDPRAPDGVRLTRSGSDHPVHCAGLRGRARPRRKRVTFAVPQSCFRGRAGRARIVAYTYHVRGTPREADYMMDSWSRWVARG